MNNTPAPNTSYDRLTRLQIWWVTKTPRQQALRTLIGYSIFLAVTNGLPFWSLGDNAVPGLFCLHLYLWCVGITGWCLYGWTKNHPMEKNRILLWLFGSAFALAVVIAIVVIAASGTHDNRRR